MMESALLNPEGEDDHSSPPVDTNTTKFKCKSTLLSNLVESDSNHELFQEEEEEEDLFGSLDRVAQPPPVTVPVIANNNVDNNPLTLSKETSKLSASGLIQESDDGGGGLFDDIDEPPQQQAAEDLPPVRVPIDDINSNNAPSSSPKAEPNHSHEPDIGLSKGGMGLGGSIPRESVQPQPQVMNAMAGSYCYSTSGAGQMHYPPNQQQQQQQGSALAGMHVGHNVHLGGVPQYNPSSTPASSLLLPHQQQHAANQYNHHTHHQPTAAAIPKALTDYTPSPPFRSPYGKITVSEPMLIQGTGLFAGPPHWTYLVTLHKGGDNNNDSNNNSNNSNNNLQPISAVRRRFRHFVALETRLRQSTPGAILPPRPEKHPTRAIEEASARQSSEFALLRSSELTVYMNALAHHPHFASSPELKLFLTLQDHIGTAWPEVSGSALTRITAAGTLGVDKLAEGLDGILSDALLSGSSSSAVGAGGEDDAEILALAAYEGRRIGAVAGSVPKIEGAVNILQQKGDKTGATGLEMSKLAKDAAWCDRELSGPMEVLSSALLRAGRRNKRCGIEMHSAVSPFVTQYKLCKYEQMAFADRRTALKRRSEARGSADRRAAKVMMNQYHGRMGTSEKLEMEAVMYDEMATEAAREAEEVAMRLRSEVGRIGSIRVREWDGGVRAVACGMKEACGENAAIWEAALECFKRDFPEVMIPELGDAMNGMNGNDNRTEFV